MCITVDEINLAVKNWNVVKHLFDIDILAPIICDRFIAVFNSSCYPEDWFNGIIVPLNK